jgi:hypothetical protein
MMNKRVNSMTPAAVLMANLTSEFYGHLDDRNYEEAIKAFAPDGVWFRRGAPVVGHDAIREAMEARPINFHTRHVVTNVRVYLQNEKEGYVVFYLTGHPHIGEIPAGEYVPLPSAHILATYRDTMRRVDERWVITEKMLLSTGFKDQVKLP